MIQSLLFILDNEVKNMVDSGLIGSHFGIFGTSPIETAKSVKFSRTIRKAKPAKTKYIADPLFRGMLYNK